MSSSDLRVQSKGSDNEGKGIDTQNIHVSSLTGAFFENFTLLMQTSMFSYPNLGVIIIRTLNYISSGNDDVNFKKTTHISCLPENL